MKKFFLLIILLTSQTTFVEAVRKSACSPKKVAKEIVTKTPNKSGLFEIYPAAEMLEVYVNSTPNTIKENIQKYSPSRALFEINYTLNHTQEKTSKAEAQKYFKTALISFILLHQTVDNTPPQIERDRSRLLSIMTSLKKNKGFVNSLRNKEKKFFERHLCNGDKVARIDSAQLIPIFFKKQTKVIQNAIQQLKENLLTFSGLSLDRKLTLTAMVHAAEHHEKLEQLVCLFGCSTAYEDLKSHVYHHYQDFDDAKMFKFMSIFIYALDPLERCNYAIKLGEKGEIESAIKWATIAGNEGNATAKMLAMHLEKTDGIQKIETYTKTSLQSSTQDTHFNLAIKLLEECDMNQIDSYRKKIKEAGLHLIKAANDGHKEATDLLPHILLLAELYEECILWTLKKYAVTQDNKLLFPLGRSYYLLGQYQESLTYLNQYKGENKKLPNIQFDLANCCFWLGKYEKAKEYLKIPLADQMPEAFLYMVYIMLEENNKEAAKEFIAILEKDKLKHLDIYHNALLAMGTHALKSNHNEDAYKELEKAIAIKDTLQAWYSVGIYHYINNDIEKAVKALEKALISTELKCEGMPNCVPQLHAHLGICYGLQNRFGKALRHAHKAYRQGLSKIAFNIAYYYDQIEKVELAHRYYKEAIAKNVKGAVLAYALFLDRQQQQQQAEKLLHQAEIDLKRSIKQDDNSEESENSDQDEETQEITLQEESSFVLAKDSKRYRRYLASLEKAKEKVEAMKAEPKAYPQASVDKSYKDLNVTFSKASLAFDICDNEIRIKSLLSALANKQGAGKFEYLTGYNRRCSMRITQGDRLVFDIVEGSMNAPEGIKSIVIISAKGHYKNITEKEYNTPTDIKVEWSEDEKTDDNSEEL